MTRMVGGERSNKRAKPSQALRESCWARGTVVLIYLIVNQLHVRRIIIMTTTIKLNCWIIGDDPGRIFSVRIERTESVDALKKAIKEETKPALDNVPAHNLVLWNVSIPSDDDLEEKLEKLNLDSKHALQPLIKLSSLFADQPVDDHLNIVVNARPTSEF